MDQVIPGGYGANVSGTTFMLPVGYAPPIALEGQTAVVFPCPGRIHDLHFKLPTAPGAGESRTLQFKRALESATSPSVTISEADTDGEDLSSEFVVAAGDAVSMQHSDSGSPAPSNLLWSHKFTPNTAKYSVLMGNGGSTFLSATDTQYLALSGQFGAIPTNEFYAEMLISTPGIVRLLYVVLSGPPGSGNSRSFTVRKNGVSQTLTTTISGGTDFKGNDTAHSFAVVPGDTIAIQAVPTSNPNAAQVQASVVFEADTDGLYIIPCSTSATYSSKADVFVPIWRGDAVPTSIEANRRTLAYVGPQIVSLENMYIELSASPGLGKQVTFMLRRGGANTALTKAISSSNTTGNVTASVPIVDGDLLATRIRPTLSPSTRRFHVSYTAKVNAPSVWIKGGTLLGGKIGP